MADALATGAAQPVASEDPVAHVPLAPPATPRTVLRVGQWLGLTIGVLLALAVLSIGVALVVNQRLSDRRHVVLDQVEPALQASLRLENGLIDQETGVRGFLLTGESAFLQPFYSGHRAEQQAYAALRAQARIAPSRLLAALEAVRARAHAWRMEVVEPSLVHERRVGRSLAASALGKERFDAVRRALASLQSYLGQRLSSSRRQLDDDARTLQVVLLLAGGLILVSVLAAGFVLRAIITKPLARLGADASRVAAGEFEAPLRSDSGAREIALLAAEFDVMRRRILAELAQVRAGRAALEQQALELQRSNSDLEQFAYVASHDLQEPLRKVASFCQALEQRYRGQLDARADQYIDFAVDGARRMQILINDLLEFSRVGRGGAARERVELEDVLEEARRSLSAPLREAAATIEHDPLPSVRGERSLLVSLLQNLLANAVKFRDAEPLHVRLSASREGEMWELSCADNGIGIEPEYAERIFVIFQRLHSKEAYEGTGIGLALCRKIVEYHGGSIWLDTNYDGGACIRFTLPLADEENE
ncbi:MAG TPA: ATP-binding protein [Solirubrobacteraceae bacterium]|jgi:signal transduction histidine kinase|nr:ATP-binding protein [Solirubrobacteraceae bacterium]